jgi:hypothetical protein
MSLARRSPIGRVISAVALIAFAAGCDVFATPDYGDAAPSHASSEAKGSPVSYTPADANCVQAFQDCWDACPSDPSSCDWNADQTLCTPDPSKVQSCQAACDANKRCFPWERGVRPGPPCRTSNDEYECNFPLCWQAAYDCNEDCFRVYAALPPDAYRACLDHCDAVYGCKPRENDPCNPLPAGDVYCGCPGVHGANCHPADYPACP